MDNQHLVFSLITAFFLHFPFGVYGARFKRFTKPWGRCLYVPIVITIILRRSLGISYNFIPYFMAVAITGQIIGKRLGRKRLDLTTHKTGQT